MIVASEMGMAMAMVLMHKVMKEENCMLVLACF